MPSGKASKRRRKAGRVPPPPVGRQGRRRQASPRVLLAFAAVVALAVLAVVLGLVFAGGTKTTVAKRGSLTNALPGAADVHGLLAGIPQHGNVLGSSSARATMVEYVDLQCPYCQEFETQAMPELIRSYVRSGKLRVEARPIAFIGPDSERGRAAALAAGQQDRMFDFMQILYLNQRTENTGWLDEGMVEHAAASIPGLDVPRLLDVRNSASVKAQEKQLDAAAAADEVHQTPTILVGKTGGALHEVALASPADEQSVAAAVDAALR